MLRGKLTYSLNAVTQSGRAHRNEHSEQARGEAEETGKRPSDLDINGLLWLRAKVPMFRTRRRFRTFAFTSELGNGML